MRAAVALAALYGFCVLAPHAAFAFAQVAAHCLTEPGVAHVHPEPVKTAQHVHADGAEHDHHGSGAAPEHSGDEGRSHGGNCCGLFCVTALPHEPVPALSVPPAARLVEPGALDHLTGRGPDRINRPPIG